METVHNLEKTVAEWYKNVPHLPKELRKWLGDNVWWLVLIGVVVSVFGVFATISTLLVVLGLGGLAFSAAGVYGSYVASGVIGFAWLSVLISLLTLLAVLVLMGMAVTPLKAKAKKGWTLLFVVLLVSVVLNVVGNLVGFNIVGILWVAIWAAVEGYFLFEIRDEFGKAPAKPKAAAAK